MKKIRNSKVFEASYSTLELWKQNKIEDAVNLYFRLKNISTPAMDMGRKLHKSWEEETKKTGCLPKIFGGEKLKNPKTEIRGTVEMADWLKINYVIDLQTDNFIADYKSGKTSSTQYAESMQLPIYAFCLYLKEKKLYKVARIYHFDQYKKETDYTEIWLSLKHYKDAQNYIETYASEMYQYLLDNKLHERYQ